MRHKLIQQQWLATYEAVLVAAVPALAGKVDWDAANYWYYRGGDTPEAAAAFMAKRWYDHDDEDEVARG